MTHPTTSTLDASAGTAPAPAAAPSSRLVTDAPTRMFHWLFALSFLGAYLTAEGEHFRLLHVTLGYTMAGLLAFRVLYGMFGPRQARLGALWRKLAGAPAWLRALAHTRSPGQVNWRQGQNLLMALAVVALLVMVIPLTLTGYGAYNEWAGDWLNGLHELAGNAVLFVVLAHIGLILMLSLLRRRNQALPMLTGRAPGAGPSLVKKNRVWLAMLLLVSVMGYVSWEWQQSPNGLISTQAIGKAASGGHHGHGD
jgi:cytochrome b